jgi:hypothetical protein
LSEARVIAKGKRIRDVRRLSGNWPIRNKASESESIMIVKLKKKNARYRDLTFGQPYVVIGIEGDDLRILNDAGRPFLYPPSLFSLVDPREPVDWVTEFGDDGERYSYPPPLNKSGFFEDFFDQKAKAVATFWRVVNQRLAGSQRRVA